MKTTLDKSRARALLYGHIKWLQNARHGHLDRAQHKQPDWNCEICERFGLRITTVKTCLRLLGGRPNGRRWE